VSCGGVLRHRNLLVGERIKEQDQRASVIGEYNEHASQLKPGSEHTGWNNRDALNPRYDSSWDRCNGYHRRQGPG
jgi:hypothetical protein